MSCPFPENEQERLKELEEYQILDTAPEQEFDDLTALASFICETPIALITLLEKDRQWFKSKVGMDADENARELAFCSHAIMQEQVMIVADTLNDERFANHPLVIGEPNIRFYAGAPLTTPKGYNLGTLCIVDKKPKQLTTQQHSALKALARQVISLLELRRASSWLVESNRKNLQLISELESALEEIKTLRGILPICANCKSIRDDGGYWEKIEVYFKQHSGVDFSHGICPNCLKELYPDYPF